MWADMGAEPCTEGQSAPLQPPMPHWYNQVMLLSVLETCLFLFFLVARIWRRHTQVRCCSVEQAENSVNEHLRAQTMNAEISDIMSYLFPSSCLCFTCSILFATSHFHFQAPLS